MLAQSRQQQCMILVNVSLDLEGGFPSYDCRTFDVDLQRETSAGRTAEKNRLKQAQNVPFP